MTTADEMAKRLERLVDEYNSRRLQPRKLKKWQCPTLRLPLRPRRGATLPVWCGEGGEGGTSD
jgi:hypothetical protein